MDLALSIKVMMHKTGTTRNDIAEGIGSSEVVVGRWINGSGCNTRSLNLLADFFNMPVSEFIRLGEQ